jgi:hypothetical protein
MVGAAARTGEAFALCPAPNTKTPNKRAAALIAHLPLIKIAGDEYTAHPGASMKALWEAKRQIKKGLGMRTGLWIEMDFKQKNERPGALTALKQVRPGRSRRPYVFAFLIA